MHSFKLILLTAIFNCCCIDLIFLENSMAQIQSQNEFNLSLKDINLIKKTFKKKKYVTNFSNLPEIDSSISLRNYFSILKDQEHDKWIPAYLYLLSIVPEMFMDEEIGC